MKVSGVNNNQSFKGLYISGNMPKCLRRAIVDNLVIQKAKKNYSVFFSFNDEKLYNAVHCMVQSPKTDSLFESFVTPPHSVTYAHHWFGFGPTPKNYSKMGKILSEINGVAKTPDFFEKLAGKPRTLKDKLLAFKESFQIAFADMDELNSKKVTTILNKYKKPLEETIK